MLRVCLLQSVLSPYAANPVQSKYPLTRPPLIGVMAVWDPADNLVFAVTIGRVGFCLHGKESKEA